MDALLELAEEGRMQEERIDEVVSDGGRQGGHMRVDYYFINQIFFLEN